MLVGVLMGTSDPRLPRIADHDPVAALTAPLPTWFLVPFLLVVTLSVISSGE